MTYDPYEPGEPTPPARSPIFGYVLTAILIALLIVFVAWLLDPNRGGSDGTAPTGTSQPGDGTSVPTTLPEGTTLPAPSTTVPEQTSTTG